MLKNCAAGLVCLLASFITEAQTSILHAIEPLHLEITDAQTTNILFPYPVQSVDRGNGQVLTQMARGVKNILQLKAARPLFPATNVSVVTSDGQFYSFLLHYAEHPSPLNVEVIRNTKAQLVEEPIAADSMAAIAEKVNNASVHFHVQTSGHLLRLRLRNVFIDSSGLWLAFRLTNYSAVPFHPDLWRFYIKEKKQRKRTAVQEKYLTPIYCDTLQGLTVTFTPFTIKRSQHLYIQIGERTGARLLTLPIKYKTLLKARPLP